MNKNLFAGQWKVMKGLIKQIWGRLSEDDFAQIKGNQKIIYEKLQTYYGYTQEEAEKAIKEFNRMVTGEKSEFC